MEPTEIMEATPVDVKTLTKEQILENYNGLQESMKIAQFQIDQLSKQLTESVNRYNKDVQYLQGVQANTIKYSREKEFNLMKILEGAMGMLNMDKMPIAPEKGDNDND
jgi:hypothetical protein